MIRISKIFIALSGFFSLCSFLNATPAFADDALCSQWDVGGSWHVVQTNKTMPELSLEQTGTQFRGSAQYAHREESSGFYSAPTSGPIVGTVTGNSFEATVYWNDNKIGIYTGQIGPQGLIVGHTYDKNDPKDAADWHSDRTANCRSSMDSQNRPPVALGRVHSTTPAPPPERMGSESMICAQARSARARHSPVAPELEARCQEAGGSFTDRGAMQAPSNVRARNTLALSRVGIPAPPANPPPAEVPPPEAPRMPDDRGVPGESFAPPLFDDGAQLWACANAAQGSKKAGVCNGMKAGKAFCGAKGHSGALRQHRDGSPPVTVAPARAGIPVRAANGDVCAADNCVVVGELDCAP